MTDEALYESTVKVFSKQKYISTAKIQREMHVGYRVASFILDKMIAEELASPRIGAWPSRILKGKFKKVKAAKAVFITNVWMHSGYYPNPKEFLK